MLKGRLGLWITVIVLCLLIPFLIDNVPQWFKTSDVLFSCEVESNEFAESIATQRIKHTVLLHQNNNADIIFSQDASPKDGYTLHENALYSPMVMYVSSAVHNWNNGFGGLRESKYYHNIDLRSVLLAMENGQSWDALGIDEHVLTGKITLYIPAQHIYFYPEVVELFYITLNDYKTPTDDEREALTPRVQNLLSLCTTVDSFFEHNKSTEDNALAQNTAYIAPEYYYQTAPAMGSSYSQEFTPVYFHKTTCVNMHIFTHDTQNTDAVSVFMNSLREHRNFMDVTGWRTKDSTFNVADVSYVYAKAPN